MNAASATQAATIHGFTLGFQSALGPGCCISMVLGVSGAPGWPDDGGGKSDKNYSLTAVFQILGTGEVWRY
jgi:hypothetical protein